MGDSSDDLCADIRDMLLEGVGIVGKLRSWRRISMPVENSGDGADRVFKIAFIAVVVIVISVQLLLLGRFEVVSSRRIRVSRGANVN